MYETDQEDISNIFTRKIQYQNFSGVGNVVSVIEALPSLQNWGYARRRQGPAACQTELQWQFYGTVCV
jgi:hypothetical protein